MTCLVELDLPHARSNQLKLRARDQVADCVESAAASEPGPLPGFGPPPPALLEADAEAWLPWSTCPLPPPFPTLTDVLSFFGPFCLVEASLAAL